VARAVRGQPGKQRAPVGPPAGAGVDRNYFASVVDELRKVVWPTWNELGRMTGVVVTTVILMAIIVSAADYGLGLVVKQLYNSAGTSTAGSQVAPQGSQVAPNTPSLAPSSSVTTAPTASGTTAPVTP
jgi:preprotein translocase subunit SecE